MGRIKSVLQKERYCKICKAFFGYENQRGLHVHHVFFGNGIRQLSEQYGMTVYLCAGHHNLPASDEQKQFCVHENIKVDLLLKQWAQRKAMRYYNWSEDEFRQIFKKSYL